MKHSNHANKMFSYSTKLKKAYFSGTNCMVYLGLSLLW